MSRKLFAFLLSELTVARVICRRPECGAVTEVSLARLRAADSHCPVCRHDLLPGFGRDQENALARLARVIEELNAHAPNVQVEFVLPDRTGG